MFKPTEISVPKADKDDIPGPGPGMPQADVGAWADDLRKPNPTEGDNNRGSAFFKEPEIETPKADTSDIPSPGPGMPQAGTGVWADDGRDSDYGYGLNDGSRPQTPTPAAPAASPQSDRGDGRPEDRGVSSDRGYRLISDRPSIV